MYQFTTTNIINSSLDSNGTTLKFVGDAQTFKVARVNTFKAMYIISAVKRPYYAEKLEIAQVTVPVIAAGLVARLDVDVRLSQQTDSEYANTYLYFKKPVVVEVIATGTAADDATALANELNSLRDRYGFAYITATTSGADIILTATNANQRFFNAKILKEQVAPYVNTIIEPLYTDVTAGTFAVTDSGRVGFGDDDWMARRIMLPTAENVRYFGISKDERPVLGGMYTQFTIKYMVEKDHTEGVWQANSMSVTTHVFYVLDSLVASFEDQLDNATTVTEILGGGLIVISGAATLANNGTTTLTAAGTSGTEVWTVESGTSVTVDAPGAGAITADATIDGVTVIKVTDAEGSSATFSVTVS